MHTVAKGIDLPACGGGGCCGSGLADESDRQTSHGSGNKSTPKALLSSSSATQNKLTVQRPDLNGVWAVDKQSCRQSEGFFGVLMCNFIEFVNQSNASEHID